MNQVTAYIPTTALQPQLATYLQAVHVQLAELAETTRLARKASKYQHDYQMHQLHGQQRRERRALKQQQLIAIAKAAADEENK